MPPKKVNWGDIHNSVEVKCKDVNGKWICCKICDVKIRVRSQFSLTEWKTHIDGVKHNELTNSKVLKNCQKLTKFFPKKRMMGQTPQQTTTPPKKVLKLFLAQDFTMVITQTFYNFM